MITSPVNLTLMVGTVLAVPTPASLTAALREVVVSTSDTEMSSFQLTFGAEPGASLLGTAADALLLKPFSRVVVIAGRPFARRPGSRLPGGRRSAG